MKNSVFSVNNEVSASFVKVNVDLSLFRCQPSPEFLPIATALTKRRKDEAENGQMRYTALKLGCLFKALIPNTPLLVRAYGTRVSEIIQDPATNPTGRDDDGPFKDFVGADARSIWAAATSGPAAIATYLLACMLSNAWKPIEATGIWVELVRERQKQIQELKEGNGIVDQETLLSAHQEISRSELQTWDASARAWLRRAAESNSFQGRQFAIIADNISLPWTTTGTTYQRVTKSWVTAMTVLENLLNNNPQQASDRAILHAISSWHLYPDLLVFQDKATKVPLKDALFPSAGVLSLGIEYVKKGNSGPDLHTWSLALSHLRHYGDPVRAQGKGGQQRLTIDDLWLVILGSVLHKWAVSNGHLEDSIRWFGALGEAMRASSRSKIARLAWLRRLCAASSRFLEIKEQVERNHRESLIKYGWRRGETLLGSEAMGLGHPFFGLCNAHVMAALGECNDVERGITYLRSISGSFEPAEGGATLIWYSRQLSDSVTEYYHELATTKTVMVKIMAQESIDEGGEPFAKRRVVDVTSHVRWIFATYKREQGPMPLDYIAILRKRQEEIEARGEKCFIITEAEEMPEDHHDKIIWSRPPSCLANTDGVVGLSKVFQSLQDGTGSTRQAGFTAWAKDSAALYGIYSTFPKVQSGVYVAKGTLWLQTHPPTEEILSQILVYLEGTLLHGRPETPTGVQDTSSSILGQNDSAYHMFAMNLCAPSSWAASLRVADVASTLYAQIPNATVSPRIVETPLHQARWMPKDDAEMCATTMPRENIFACIAMFDSGRFNLDPNELSDVIALGSEDSLFVSDILLSDPATHGSQRTRIRHLIGNTGHAGMVLLISPMEPKVRKAGYDPSLVHHRAFDGTRRDDLAGTSLHLSFTDWKVPLDWELTGEIDQEIFLLESVVSVQHAGGWIADIDVVHMERQKPFVFESACDGCYVDEKKPDQGSDDAQDRKPAELGEAVSISSWNELLDPPPSQTVSVLHARGNWVARLAAASILCQKGHGHCIALLPVSPGLCWSCFAERFNYPEPFIPQYIID